MGVAKHRVRRDLTAPSDANAVRGFEGGVGEVRALPHMTWSKKRLSNREEHQMSGMTNGAKGGGEEAARALTDGEELKKGKLDRAAGKVKGARAATP